MWIFRSELGTEENIRVQICRPGEFWTRVAAPCRVRGKTDVQGEDLQCICTNVHAPGNTPTATIRVGNIYNIL
jgi:hypothetical protein